MARLRGVLLVWLIVAVVVAWGEGVPAAGPGPVPPGGGAASGAPTCHGHRATIFGDGTLVGTAGRDVMVGTLPSGGSGTEQIINGRGGDDLVCAGPSGARLLGGKGDDRLFGRGGVADVLNGGLGDDLLKPGSDAGPCCGDLFTFDGGKHGVRVDLKTGRATGQGHDRLVVGSGGATLQGSAHHDVLLGSDDTDDFLPEGGNDLVRGRGGDDVISSGSGADVLYGGAGRDRIFACNGSMFGGRGGDALSAAVGVHVCDDVSAGFGPALLSGGKGPDHVTFSYELRDGDVASGGPGVDELGVFFGINDHANQTSDGPLSGDLGTGSFTLSGRHASYQEFERWSFEVLGGSIITGTEGPDVLSVGLGPLTAHLLGGNDTVGPVDLAPADDFVDGGDGNDSADLGDGSDVCANVETGPC